MNDETFLKWFASSGFRWRGWPIWEAHNKYGEWEEGLNCGMTPNSITVWQWRGKARVEGWADSSPCGDYIAACLVRDHLLSQGRLPTRYVNINYLTASCEERNAMLCAAVEAQMAEEAMVLPIPPARLSGR